MFYYPEINGLRNASFISRAWNSSKGSGKKGNLECIVSQYKQQRRAKTLRINMSLFKGKHYRHHLHFLYFEKGPISALCKVKISSKQGCFLFKNKPKQNPNNLDWCMFYMISVWERGGEEVSHFNDCSDQSTQYSSVLVVV